MQNQLAVWSTAAALVAALGCAREHEPQDPASTETGRDASAAGEPARDASIRDAASSTDGAAGTRLDAASPDAGPNASAIGDAQPLGEALSFAFKAGYHDQEQVWLHGEDGALVRVSTWDVDPNYIRTCGEGWSTIGYNGGRFGPMQFDAKGERLLFAEYLTCRLPIESSSRLIAHELVSGATVPPAGIELFELTSEGDALRPIAVPESAAWLRVTSDPGYLLAWNDRVLLLVDETLADTDVVTLTASPSGTRLERERRRDERHPAASENWSGYFAEVMVGQLVAHR